MRLRRREFLGAGPGAGVAALVGTTAAHAAEADVLADAFTLEQRLALAYNGLRRGSNEVASLFARQSREHARGLARALADRGRRPPADPVRPRVTGLPDVVRLEQEAIAFYYRAHGTLRPGLLVADLASIMANHGQHAVVLRQELGRNPLPSAFPRGR
jgi:hypothetical protein